MSQKKHTFLLKNFNFIFLLLLIAKSYICGENFNFEFMPKIYEYFGFIFYFYSNEHEPIHVHVIHGERECIFDLIISNGELVDILVRKKKGYEILSDKDRNIAESFIRQYYKEIIEKWVTFFVLKQNVKCTVIKKKI